MPEFEGREPFFSTIHSMLEGVAGLAPERREEKLQQLVNNYGQQLSGCLMRKYGLTADDAAEVVQQFLLARLLIPVPEQNLAGQFLTAQRDQPHLRFRNYLRRSLYNFFVDQRRRRQVPVVQVENLEFVAGSLAESADDDLREDVSWANHLLNQACNAVQQECYLRNQADVWKIFHERILRPIETGEAAVSYTELCEKGLATNPKQAANLLQTAIRKFNRVLGDLVAGYLPCDEETLPDAVRQELDELQRALASPHAVELTVVPDYSVATESGFAAERKQLLHVREDVDSLWTDRDLAEFWNSLMSKRPHEILKEMSVAEIQMDSLIITDHTLQQLIEDSHPPLEVLTAIKDVAKQSAAPRGSENRPGVVSNVFPPGITMMLYGLSIAIARLRWNQRISSDADHRFIPRVCRLLEFSWIDPQSRQVMQQWLEVLER